MSRAEFLLNKFVQEQRDASCIGSGDDMFYANQIRDYIRKQKKLWLDYTTFILERKNEKRIV